MSERKTISISVGTLVCIFIIIILVIALVAVCSSKFSSSKSSNEVNSNSISTEQDLYSQIYEACEINYPGVIYRDDTGGSSPFFIKDGILYSGEESVPESHSETIGITGKVKCVVPLNKQTGETVALTDDGKLYINISESGVYGSTFRTLLTGYRILEILEIPNTKVLFYLSDEGKIYYRDGSLYANLLK